METARQFIAESLPEAVQQAQDAFGPAALVLEVGLLPRAGITRWWRKPRVQVTAMPPSTPSSEPPPDLWREMRQELRDLKAALHRISAAENSAAPADPEPAASGWRIGSVLRQSGLLPLYTQRLLEQLQSEHGPMPPVSLAGELHLLRELLLNIGAERLRPCGTRRRHVFIGPPGAGKTTVLCKWLSREVLLGARPARVWQWHARTAHTSDLLALHTEALGVPLQRVWQSVAAPGAELEFVDLPGTLPADPEAMRELSARLDSLGEADVHLVLNAAYDSAFLVRQARQFSALHVTDVILTHLDEEKRWGKIWNLLLGTNCSIGHFSAGQNVPGEFYPACPETLLQRHFG